MEELRPGLWTWTAPHPEWTPDSGGPDGWDRVVRSYALDTGGALVLIDPLAPPSRVDELAAGREVAVVLTVGFHERSAQEVQERLGARVHAPAEGDDVPPGIEARPTAYPDEVALWIPSHRAIVFGDVVLGGEGGIRAQPDSWLNGVTREDLNGSLRPLLELPIELVLVTHGDPVTDDATGALRRALA